MNHIMPRHSVLAIALTLFCNVGARAEALAGAGTFILHLVAKPAGKETYTLRPTSTGLHLQSHFEYSDRGTPVPLDYF
jgi:hypothetical protein